MPDDPSPLAPPLPIPNRTVKRRRADDSTEFPCESRSSSGTLTQNASATAGALVFVRPPAVTPLQHHGPWWAVVLKQHKPNVPAPTGAFMLSRVSMVDRSYRFVQCL